MPSSQADGLQDIHPRRASLLLVAGTLLGMVLAASGLVKPGGAAADSDSVAHVAGTNIAKSDYLAYLDLVAREKRNPLSADDQRHLLNRMIDEQLLLTRGLEVGLPLSSYPVRQAIVQELTQSIVAAAVSEAIDEAQLRQFYADNSAYFANPARTHLRRMVFSKRRGRSARENAEQAYLAIQSGVEHDTAYQRYAAPDPMPLPAEALPDHKLLQYLGPSLTARVADLPAGASTEPIGIDRDFMLLYVVSKQPLHSPSFAAVRSRVTAEYERRRSDRALGEYLQELRRQADLSIDEDFLIRIAPPAAMDNKH